MREDLFKTTLRSAESLKALGAKKGDLSLKIGSRRGPGSVMQKQRSPKEESQEW